MKKPLFYNQEGLDRLQKSMSETIDELVRREPNDKEVKINGKINHKMVELFRLKRSGKVIFNWDAIEQVATLNLTEVQRMTDSVFWNVILICKLAVAVKEQGK